MSRTGRAREIVDIFPTGELVGGQYKVIERLGAGAMGAVYLVEDTQLARLAALKTLHLHILEDRERAVFLARFRLEAKAAANIRHDSIIEIYNAGEHRGHAYFVMEYIANAEGLDEIVVRQRDQGSFVPLEHVHPWFLQAAAGLRAIHDAGAIHRDLKLDNLLVYHTAEGPRLKILDFGVVHLPDSDLTHTSQMVGTPSYFAPEYVAAKFFGRQTRIDHRIDLFALGVALYRALTGKKPFEGTDYTELYTALRDQVPPLPSTIRPELSPGWDRVTMTLLEKSPERRYHDAGALYNELRHIDDLPSYVPPPATEATSTKGAPPDPLGADLPPIVLPPDAMGSGSVAFAQASQSISSSRSVPAPLAPPLTGAAAELARALGDADTPRKRLPVRLRIALGGAGAVVLLFLVAILSSRRGDKADPTPPQTPLVDASAVQTKPVVVTPEQLLRDETTVRRKQLITGPSASPLRASEPSSVSAATAARAAERQEATRPRARNASSSAAVPAAERPGAAPATTAPEPRRRKDVNSIIAYFDPSKAPAANTGAPAARLGVGAATRVAARLEVPLSSDSNTPAIAVLTDALKRADGTVVAPAGARVMGTAQFRPTGDTAGRVEISFTRLLLEGGEEKAIRAIAVMADGAAGLRARVTTHDGRTGANLAETALDGVDAVLSTRLVDRFIEDERSDARSKRRKDVTLSVPANTSFLILFTESA